ncbi:hypothetical protein YC2023_040918 [Brassica napus]
MSAFDMLQLLKPPSATQRSIVKVDGSEVSRFTLHMYKITENPILKISTCRCSWPNTFYRRLRPQQQCSQKKFSHYSSLPVYNYVFYISTTRTVIVYLSLWDEAASTFRGLLNSGEKSQSVVVVNTVYPKIFGGICI